MEEETGIKVTRRMRRLSIEAEDIQSPSAQLTPTKKRGSRLAVKPQLELIDEIATETDKPKRTRKSTVRYADAEEKAVTPSRRSTRVKSNTSIVSESPGEVEDKGTPSRRSTRIRSNTSIVSEIPGESEDKGTPSRRNTRIKSNTSVVAEAAQHVDSPRAKRAARRIPQVGSDNEAPITPGRSTRRNRKDSTSSIDKKGEINFGKIEPQVKEVIIEENEINIKDSKSRKTPIKEKCKSPTARKSPRFENTSPTDTNNKENEMVKESTSPAKVVKQYNISEEINRSVSTSNLINQMHSEPKRGHANLNKTTSPLNETKSKRHRTKSWTTITSCPTNDNNFLSDTEVIRKRNASMSIATGSGDNETEMNTRNKVIEKLDRQHDKEDILLNCSSKSDKKEERHNDNSTVGAITPLIETKNKKDLSTSISMASSQEEPNLTEKFFSEAPSGTVQSLVYIEDSDSNTDSVEKDIDSGDQCVPIVEHQLDDQTKEPRNNLSYEPMDVDETMPENISLSVFTGDKTTGPKHTDFLKQKSLQNISQVDESDLKDGKGTISNKFNGESVIVATSSDVHVDNNDNKSKRKSSAGAVIIDDHTCMPVDSVNNSSNKSKRKSSIAMSTTIDEKDNNTSNSNISKYNTDENVDRFKRKSTNTDKSITEDNNNAKNKNSLSIFDNDGVIFNKSIKNLDTSIEINNDDVDNSLNITDHSLKECSKKSKKISITENSAHKSSHDHTSDLFTKSKRKSSFSKMDSDDNMDNNTSTKNSSKKSERMSIPSNLISEDNANISLNKSNVSDEIENTDKATRKSSSANIINNDEVDGKLAESGDDIRNQVSCKFKRKSSVSITSNDTIHNCSKSKKKSSISHIDSNLYDKSSTEDKSTLLLSKINDMSETSLQKDNNELSKNDILSKSINVSNVMKSKEINENNLSLSTSTPLQQKTLNKIDMTMNSSIITPKTITKSDKKRLDRSKRKVSDLSQNDEDPSDDDEDDDTSDEDPEESSEDESMDNSKLVENEADEASDDYESGDSRDEEAKKYEQEHEIHEKGETLDSEDEHFSDDSEYEKDSFIVDSDEDDAQLLSSSGDDLSMSADELNMTAKSKNKFNKRKIKEQKKASREMFEARHKLNESNSGKKSDKVKAQRKVNRQRLESSGSDSEVDIGFLSKKNRRARIVSSQDISMAVSDANKSTKDNLLKILSGSACEENSTYDKEISIRETFETEKEDPLTLQNLVKEEPKTPQKELSVSTIAIINEVERVDIKSNVSIMKSNQTADPLQITVSQDEVTEEDSEESISENEEITQNYESVLSDLNKKSNKIKSKDLSLNLNKKTKQKTKEPIVDKLNLTQVKKSKKTKQDAALKILPEKTFLTNKIKETVNKAVNNQDEGSSDSIDMKLLFNDDSTDGESKGPSRINHKKVEEFIPLKRTDGKTNMLESTEVTGGDANQSLNGSKSKKIRQKSSTVSGDDNNGNLSFFIDTVGTHTDINENGNNTSITGSAKKKKNNKNNISATNIEDLKQDDNSNDAPLEISYHSNKMADRSKYDVTISRTEEQSNITADGTSAKKNKKKKKGLDISQAYIENENKAFQAEILSNVPIGSAKKQKQKMVLETVVNEEEIVTQEEIPDIIQTKTARKRKRKSSNNQSIEEANTKDDAIPPVGSKTLNDSLTSNNQKKKQKIKNENVEVTEPGAATISENKGDAQVKVTEKPKSKAVTSANQKKKQKHKNENVVMDLGATANENQQHEQEKLPHIPKNKNVPEHNPVESDALTKSRKKRKERDDDISENLSKAIKQNYFDEVHVPRLPTNVLRQLDDKPKKNEQKQQLISTTSFSVHETRQKRNKPSHYLEQSVYLNESIEEQTKKRAVKIPKVLPFIPTASTSDHGFTTKFRVNVISQETQFVAKSSDMSNFKNDYLQKNRIKKMGTFERYKRQRNFKISKF